MHHLIALLPPPPRYALADGTSTPSPVTRQAMNDAVARLQAQGVEPPPAQATFLAAPGVPYCGLGQVRIVICLK